MAKSESAIIDCDDMPQKRAFMQVVGSWRGSIKVTWKPCRPIRSLLGNKYYFAGCVEPFRQYLIESEGDPRIDLEQAHETLKLAVLGAAKSKAGVPMMPSTKRMEQPEFNEYVELAIAWLASFCNIAVVPSELFLEAKRRGETISTKIQ